MWGVLLVPSSSPTLSPIYDGLDVNVASKVTWFHLNHDMASRRIYKAILLRRALHYSLLVVDRLSAYKLGLRWFESEFHRKKT